MTLVKGERVFDVSKVLMQLKNSIHLPAESGLAIVDFGLVPHTMEMFSNLVASKVSWMA